MFVVGTPRQVCGGVMAAYAALVPRGEDLDGCSMACLLMPTICAHAVAHVLGVPPPSGTSALRGQRHSHNVFGKTVHREIRRLARWSRSSSKTPRNSRNPRSNRESRGTQDGPQGARAFVCMVWEGVREWPSGSLCLFVCLSLVFLL